MRLHALPPVRRAVPVKTGGSADGQAIGHFFGARQVTIYPSGTAALAHAIRQSAERSPTKAPEVILPAYGCPDLIAACVYAGVFPRLVDVSPGAWGYSHRDLERQVSENTVAIVAVNLLGVGDEAAALYSFCQSRGIALIQDSAQYLPRADTEWPGDYVVLSFGRGKPLNLLLGGALIARTADAEAPSAAIHRLPLKARFLASRLAAVAFNTLTRPGLYGLLSALPGTGLGVVVYTPLECASVLPDWVARRMNSAFDDYRRVPAYQRKIWEPVLSNWHRWGIEALRAVQHEPDAEPLRLALLAPDRASRDTLVSEFTRAGLGASRFYGTELTRISGIPAVARSQGPFPNAARLAARLLTLPTHTLVSVDSVNEADRIVRTWHRKRTAVACPPPTSPSDV